MPHLSRRLSAVPFARDETVIFRVRQSLALLVGQIVLLLVIALIFVLIIAQLDGIRSPIVGSFTLEQILIGLGVVAIGLVITVRLVEYLTTIYTLTNRRVQHDFGIFLKTSYAIPLAQIETLDVLQSLVGRILHYGDLKIRPTSAIIRFIVFGSVGNPKDRREQVEDQLP